MMLYLLLMLLGVLLIVNVKVVEGDYMHPSFLFSLVFFIATLMCVLNQQQYKINLHWLTVCVLVGGSSLFTVLTYWWRKRTSLKSARSSHFKRRLQTIDVPNYWVILLIVLQILTVFTFVKYLSDVSLAYMGKVQSLQDSISLYDILTKFKVQEFRRLAVAIPMIYRIGNPISSAGAYLLIYIGVHNFIITKKINLLHVMSIGLMCVLIVLNGSRSPLFRVMTMIAVLYYVFSNQLHYRDNKHKFRLLAVLSVGFVVIVVGFVMMLNIMGRTRGDIDFGRYLFIYIGAPIVNLDTFIRQRFTGDFPAFFGEQTFRGLYNYIGKWLRLSQLEYTGIDYFVKSASGIEIGNVYTTYYTFLYDFSYFGVLPLIGGIAWYYVGTYEKTTKTHLLSNKLNYSMFIYSYLFNDLIMLFFSNRFYATVFDPVFLKFLISTLVMVILFRLQKSYGNFIVKKY